MKDEKKYGQVKVVIEASGIIVSVIALILSYITSQRMNRITELTNRPSLVLIEVLDVGDGFYKSKYNQEYGICRTRIRLANIGGADTFLTSGSLLIRFGNESTTLKFSDYENTTKLGNKMYFDIRVWNNNPPPLATYLLPTDVYTPPTPFPPYVSPVPLRIISHTTTDIFIDLGIATDPTKYRLLEKFLTKYQPANPTFSKNYPDIPHIAVTYTLNFSDVEPITTEAIVCFFVNNAPWLNNAPTDSTPDLTSPP